jgi:hypothetical protein
MSYKNLKTFNQFISSNILLEESTKYDKKVDMIMKSQFEKRLFNQLLMMDVVADELLTESLEQVILLINTNQFEKDPKDFYDSFMMSKRVSYLTPYSVEELKEFDLYKVKGMNIGFAIKNGDIILVHNNENVKGIGNLLMRKAIQFGGNKLDHFDGYLTGFYKSIGFKFNQNDFFADEYSANEWSYNPINIDNDKTSIYKNEISVSDYEYEIAKERYLSGRPDVVYRVI